MSYSHNKRKKARYIKNKKEVVLFRDFDYLNNETVVRYKNGK